MGGNFGSSCTPDMEPGRKYELHCPAEQFGDGIGQTRLLSVKNAGKYHQKSAVAVALKSFVLIMEVFKGLNPALAIGN
jgi:hypothetical protein